MARTRKPGTHARPAAGGVPWQANSGRRSAGATRAQTIVCLPRQRRCTLGNPAGRVRATAPLAKGRRLQCLPLERTSLPAHRSQGPPSRAGCRPARRSPPRCPPDPPGIGCGQLHTKARETITFELLRRKAIAKYRMPAPVAIGHKQDFELTAWREGGAHGRSCGQARG